MPSAAFPRKILEIEAPLIRCRPKPILRFLADIGVNRIQFVSQFAVSYILAPIYLGAPIFLVAHLTKAPAPLLTHPIFGPILWIWIPAVWSGLTWYTFFYPRRDVLELYQDRIRVKCGWRQGEYLFEDIESITLGHRRGRLSSALLRGSETGRALDRACNYSATFQLKTGKRIVFKHLLSRFDSEETNEFLSLLGSLRYDLILSGLER